MELAMSVYNWILANGEMVLVAAVAISLLIPGDFPENILYKLGDMLSLVSRKSIDLPKKKK